MTGAFLKSWVRQNDLEPDELALKLGISRTTVYSLFRAATLDRKTVLALAQIGCADPTIDEFNKTQKAVGYTK